MRQVKRMHTALGKRADEERRAARRALRSRSSVPRSGVTISGFFARVVIFYVLIAYFIVCPTDTLRERAVCRGLDSFGAKLHALEPTVKPYYRTTQKKLDPYVEEVKRYSQPYVDRVKPYYSRAEKVVGPYAEKAAKTYRQLVYPKLVSGVRYSQAMTRPYVAKATQQYTKTLAPSVDWYSKSLRQWYAVKVEPTLTQLSSTSREYGQAVYDTVSPIYTRGVPLAQHHYRTHLVPFSRQSWSISRSTYLSHIHPRALTLGGHVQRLYQTRVLPALQRFWSVFIAPQLDKIRERIFEYKAKKARAEALERVEKVSEDIAKDHGEDDFEDFIKELRDDTFVGEPESPPSPADNPPAYSADTPPPASPEELAAARVEKRNALETLQSAYEREIAALGQTEHRLLVDRLIEIRQHALDDIPTRFEALLERLDEEGDKMVGKLGKYFAKVAGDEKVEVEEKVKESEFLSEKARLKVKKMSEDVKHELEAYKLDLEAKEDKAVKQAQESVSALVSKAQEELGFGWTWFDGVTHKDWQRFHGLRKAEENLHASFAGLQSGSIKDQFLASLDPHSLLAKYASQPDSLVSAFERILSKITLKGQKELKGEWTGVVDEAQKAYDAVGGKMAALVDNIKVSASSIAGVESKPTNVAQSISSLAMVAQASASSLAQEAVAALPTIEAHREYASAAKSAYGEASHSILRAAGIEPSPTDLRQSAGSLARAASSSAAEMYAQASQSALRAAGYEPSPTDLHQSATSLAHAAQASAAAAYSNVISDYPASISSALVAASSAVDHAAENAISSAAAAAATAASVVSSLAAPHSTFLAAAPIVDRLSESFEGAKEHVNEFFGDVSQGAARAIGQEPSPTDVQQSATSLANMVSRAVSSAGSVVSSIGAPHTDFAKSAVPTPAAEAGGIKASLELLASSASLALHDATRTTAEGVSESATSIASIASASVSSIVNEASKSASSIGSVASSLASPHPSFVKSAAVATGHAVVDQAKASLSSLSSAVSQKVHDTTRTTAEGLAETATSLASEASRKAGQVQSKIEELGKPHPSYSATQA
ncbi:SPOSA6832_03265 [Sporobolomyces salmonicolor]|uniref:SPOSA6832_03265-mRNA-1:cds n=1 Tax=Sporidiobolus salmonicolor TaxID=5005 RepID=A0A0D6ENZ3_SPOSA|nr:SPOSA6832_03265 [Sporobolomyces salmonicolor]